MNWIIGILSAIFIILIVGSLILSGKKFSLSFPKAKIPNFGLKTPKKIIFWAIVIAVLFRLGVPQHTWKWFMGKSESSLSTTIKSAQKERDLNEIKIWAEENIAENIFDEDGNINRDTLIGLDKDKNDKIVELDRRLTAWRKKYQGGNWSKPATTTTRPSRSTKPAPPKQEKWIFGFSADFEQIKAAAANQNINQSSGNEYRVTEIIETKKELIFSYVVDRRTTRKAKLKLREDGYFSGMVDKEDSRKLRIWLSKDTSGNYVGYMQDWDAKYPDKQYPQVAAYLQRQ